MEEEFVEVKDNNCLNILNSYLDLLCQDKVNYMYFELNKPYKVVDKKQHPFIQDVFSDKIWLYIIEGYYIAIAEQITYGLFAEEKPVHRVSNINFISTLFKTVKK